MEPVIERAREVDERSASTKRVAEAPVDDLRQDAEAEPSGGAVLESGASVDPLQEALTLTREDVVDMAFQRNASAHPLIQVQALAAFDRAHPGQAVVRDHGSWDGRWPLPMQTEWQVREKLGMKWPCGNSEFDVEAVEAARKELLWSQMKPNEKEEFRKAAQKGWSVYADNGAVEILDRESSQKILRGMTKEEQQGKVLVPSVRVYGQKHRAKNKGQPFAAPGKCQVVVPGCTAIWHHLSCGVMHPHVAEHRNICCCPWPPVTMWLDGVLCHTT